MQSWTGNSPLTAIVIMPVMLPDWLSRASEVIRRFAIERPWTLFLVLLAMNALARPCSGTTHDARLYSLQALNSAEHGAYADDLFLRYGSQDQFSAFSRILGPAVGFLGLRLAFFCGYLVFNTLLIFAMFRLVRVLIDDALIATLALVFLVTAPLPYGGHGIFMVHEQYFTTRTIGVAVTLFALERLLKQRFIAGFALLLAASSIHPLMAFGGVMIGVGLLAATYLSQRVCLGLLGCTALLGALTLCVPMLGKALFGTMDDDWHQQVLLSTPYNYPHKWSLLDWLNAAASLVLPIAAATTVFRDDPVRRRFVLVLALAGAIGFAATFAASMSPYALLFQAQPYRVLWIAKVVQVPLAFLLITHWSQSASLSARAAALALVAFYCNTHGLTPELLIMAAIVPVSLYHAKLTSPAPEHDWIWYGAARGLVLGALVWMTNQIGMFIANRDFLAHHFDLNEIVQIDAICPLFWLVGLCIFASWSSLEVRAVPWSAAAAALLAPGVIFLTEALPDLRRDYTRNGRDMAFVVEFVQRGENKHPTIYAAYNRPDLLWIDVRANSYFDIIQSAGVIFNRDTAKEVQRRAELVGKFEMQLQRSRALFLNDSEKIGFEKLYKINFDSPPPTQDDLVRLCAEPSLDYIVIPQEFPELYAATNGRVFVYECATIRAEHKSSFSARVASRER